MIDSLTRGLVWAMLPFVASAFVMGLVSVQRIKRLQKLLDKLERK